MPNNAAGLSDGNCFSNDLVLVDNYGNTYLSIKSPHTGKVWLDRNLGAKRVCRAFNDELCFGDYYQWGRYSDGHEKVNSKSTTILSDNAVQNHNKFIVNLLGGHRDWLTKPHDVLWQGTNGINNPCPKNFRVPTIDELKAETETIGLKNRDDLYNSFLKVPSAGYRFYGDNGVDYIVLPQTLGILHSSTLYGKNSGHLYFDVTLLFTGGQSRSKGSSVRCIK